MSADYITTDLILKIVVVVTIFLLSSGSWMLRSAYRDSQLCPSED